MVGGLDPAFFFQTKEELSARELVLITLNYGIYCSPVATSFNRAGPSCAPGVSGKSLITKKTKFRRTEYFELTLGEPMGTGAVGTVHLAKVTILLEEGDTLKHDVIVKLASSKHQKAKILNEYNVYAHLVPGPGIKGGCVGYGARRTESKVSK